MDDRRRAALAAIAREHGTPAYVYFADEIRQRAAAVVDAFGGRFALSYAVKANPNEAVLAVLRDHVATLDISAIAELERGLRANYPAARMTFSGPAKRDVELRRAVEAGCGEIVCESAFELGQVDALAARAGRRVGVLVRVNPKRMPRQFGVSMAGRASQFGIDEEDVDAVLDKAAAWPHVTLRGFHIYSGTNSLSEAAIAENVGIFVEIFTRLAKQHDLVPATLVFGSGFGIPYMGDQTPLDLARLAELVNPEIDAMRSDSRLGGARCILEMGRYLVGPAGYFLTSVIGEKTSRGTEIRLCDGGFNNHLGACGMMGTVIRRNWQFTHVTARGREANRPYLLVGPLCTTIDTLATAIELPELRRGDVLAIAASGAYGLTASPTKFISHPEPREILVDGDRVIDVTESWANHPAVPSR